MRAKCQTISLQTLHDDATETSIRTAQNLGPCNSDTFRIGRLLITTVSLKDAGLRGRQEKEVHLQTDYVQDPSCKDEMFNLGLPTMFGGNYPLEAEIRALDSSPVTRKKKGQGRKKETACKGRDVQAVVVDQIQETKHHNHAVIGDQIQETKHHNHAVVVDQIQETKHHNHAAQLDIFKDPAIIHAVLPAKDVAAQCHSSQSHAHPTTNQHTPPISYPPHHDPINSHQKDGSTPPSSRASVPEDPPLVQAVQLLAANGFDLPLVWQSMGLPIHPDTVTPADVFAAAQVAGAPPALVHHVLNEAATKQQDLDMRKAVEEESTQQRSSHLNGLGQEMQKLTLKDVHASQVTLKDAHASQVHLSHSVLTSSTSKTTHVAPSSCEMYQKSHGAAGKLYCMDSPWQEALDPVSGVTYYYNITAGITQWEPPAEGFKPRMLDVSAIEKNMMQQQEELQEVLHVHGELSGGASEVDSRSLRPSEKDLQESVSSERQKVQEKQSCEPGISQQEGPTWQQRELMQQAAVRKVVEQVEVSGAALQSHHLARVELDGETAAFVRTLLPRNMAKYWLQRFSLFTKYEEGVQMDTEGWYSVTPEVLALHQAKMCKQYGNGYVVADAMAGCGGNVIQMANVFPEVMGIEISERRCNMAAHNAAVYQVQAKTHFLCCDFFQVAPELMVDAIFVSPPWGGPKYQYCETFDVLSSMLDGQRSIKELLDVCMDTVTRSWAVNRKSEDRKDGRGVVSLFLPRNTDLLQLASVVPEGCLWTVERNFVNGKLKGITLYCFETVA
ncbi:hypothetical protein CEUSTIGMA_g2998.t1 [Chlamydomonas eustigma]|uniref:Trimethylguanosine synthase n=1 Tax=Chlamydomonas eustigma TaxID=1157962 RepID=A0A250WXP6_9CHLO|nr:hypothetical protein CEUSTIGMA_g2998.t1 [Chlamydomonas eustigma]|eukprot:GAX75555.1 hypothetical protein CEUSTIGMA_g2998.t1 [Chlamydomonas eustigma]